MPSFVPLLVMLSLMSGCFGRVDMSEIPGNYAAEYDFATDKLQINLDGSYTQSILFKKDGKTISGSGRWSYDRDSGYIELIDLYVLSDGYGHPVDNYMTLPKGRARYPVERAIFTRQLRLGPDEGAPYYKH